MKIKRFIWINIGIIIISAGEYFFKIPNGFATGGVSGIGTLLGKLTSLSAARWIMILNIVLVLLGFVLLGRETGALTVYCSMMLSFVIRGLEILFPLTSPITNDTLMELIYAMLLTSAGSAIIFFCNASTGGTDIIALIIKKHSGIDTGKALLLSNCLIAASSFFVFGARTGLFSMLGLLSKAFLVDNVIHSLNGNEYFVRMHKNNTLKK